MPQPLYGPQPSRQALARERLAQALLGQGMDASPVQHPLQGLARMAQAYFGSQMLKKGEEDAAKRDSDYASGLNAALMGADSAGMIADRLAGSGNADLARMAPQYRMADIEGRQRQAEAAAKRQADQALKEWEFKNAPSQRYREAGGSMFDLQSATPWQPVWSKPEKPEPPAAPIAEYNFARGQGFQGSLLDYQKAKSDAVRRTDAVWQIDPTDPLIQINVLTGERKAMPGAEKAQAKRDQAEAAMGDTDRMITSATELLGHPGRKAGTGMSSVFNMIPGTDAYGFQTKLNTLKAQVFLPEVQKMVGMGALSNAEGEKISAAFAALDPGMKEEEFEASLRGALTYMKEARDRFARKAGQPKVDYSKLSDDEAIALSQGVPPKVRTYNPTTGKLE